MLLDEGCYYCSIRTMYRVLASRDEVRERRAQAAHPPRVRPELVADGPDQVWTQHQGLKAVTAVSWGFGAVLGMG